MSAATLPCLQERCDRLANGYCLVRETTESLAHRKELMAKCRVMAREIGFTDEDRHELSIMVTGDRRSWSPTKMTDAEVERLADYMSGFVFCATILRDRTERAGINARAARAIRGESP